MADEQEQQGPQEKAHEPSRAEEAIKDLEPAIDEGDAVKGGGADIYIQLPPGK